MLFVVPRESIPPDLEQRGRYFVCLKNTCFVRGEQRFVVKNKQKAVRERHFVNCEAEEAEAELGLDGWPEGAVSELFKGRGH